MVTAFLADAESGKQTEKPAGDKINLVTQDGRAAVLFETQDKDNGGHGCIATTSRSEKRPGPDPAVERR